MSPRPSKRVLATNIQVNGKDCSIVPNTVTVPGEEYALICEGNTLAVGDADRLSEFALYELGAKAVSHDYDLRAYGDRYQGNRQGGVTPEAAE